jgi:hypothetical protein
MQLFMKLVGVLSSLLVFLLYACPAHAEVSEESILKFLPGTWRQVQKFGKISIRGTNIYLPSGHVVERQTWIQRGSISKVVITESTWTVRGNRLTLKATKSNSPLVPAGYIDAFTVISIDDMKSVMAGLGGTAIWTRAVPVAETDQLQPGCGDARQAEIATISIRDELDGMDEAWEGQEAILSKELRDMVDNNIASERWQKDDEFSFYTYLELEAEYVRVAAGSL